MKRLIFLTLVVLFAGCNLPQRQQTYPPPQTQATLVDAPTLAASPTLLPSVTSSAPDLAASVSVQPSPALPGLDGASGAMLYAVHVPAPPNPVSRYHVTLMALPLAQSGEPLGPALVWKKWMRYVHSGMYALADPTGIVERDSSEGGDTTLITHPAAGETWGVSLGIGGYIPQVYGWTANGQGLLLNDGGSLSVAYREGIRTLISGNSNVQGASSVALSPDGQTLVYSTYSRDTQAAALWHLDVASGVAKVLAESEIDDTLDALAWSPDGQWIAFKRNSRVYIVRPDGSGLQRIEDVSTSENFEPLQWSPGGDMLALVGHSHSTMPWSQDWDTLAFQFTAYVVDVTANGFGGVRPVVPSGQPGYIDPSWSPDGQWLLVAGPSAGQAEVWLVSRDGETVRQLTSDGGTKRYPVWLQIGAP